MNMIYKFCNDRPKWKEIHNVEDWIESFNNSKKGEDGKSAKTLAQFCKEKDVESIIKEWISPIVGELFFLDTAIPEMTTRFDNYGKGRTHDLGICGHTDSGNSIFVGVEAKVNETFGRTVQQAYKYVETLQKKGKNSNLKERIDGLKEDYFPGLNLDDIRYQLLYAIAGTLCEEADIKILLLTTFETNQYDDKSGQRNDKDLTTFLSLLDANPIGEDCKRLNVRGHTIFVVNKHVKV